MVGADLPDATPRTTGRLRVVVAVVPPAGPSGVEIELDQLFIEVPGTSSDPVGRGRAL